MSHEAVSVQEAARLLHVSRQTIWRLMRAGKIRAFRVLGCTRIPLDELDKFRREQTERFSR